MQGDQVQPLGHHLLIFHTAVGVTRTVDAIAAYGTASRSYPRRWPAPSAYFTEHLNRFGSYELDLRKTPAPLRLELPAAITAVTSWRAGRCVSIWR